MSKPRNAARKTPKRIYLVNATLVERAAKRRLRAERHALRSALEDCIERLEASVPPEGGSTAAVVAKARKALKVL